MRVASAARLALTGLAVLGPGVAAAAELPPEGERLRLQRRWVAELSGWSEPGGQAVPFARSTPRERARAAAVIGRILAQRGLATRRHRYRLRNANGLVDLFLPPYRGTNLYVELPATAPAAGERTETVIVGAHYDSEPGSPGAVDNASGVAVVLALALEMDRVERRGRRFLFVFFDQEEDDEIGSRAFVRFLEEESNIHSVHVVDLAGWDPDGGGEVEIQSPAPHLEPLYRETAAELGIPLAVIAGGSSDNLSFMTAGLPVVGVFQADMTPHIHRPSDTWETVDFGYLSRMTRLVGAVLERLARP